MPWRKLYLIKASVFGRSHSEFACTPQMCKDEFVQMSRSLALHGQAMGIVYGDVPSMDLSNV